MAHTFRGCSLAFMFIITWLLIKAKIDACKRGDVTVKPSHVILLGSTVNITCSLKPRQGCFHYSRRNKLILYKFDRRINFHHGHSLNSQVTGLPLGTTLFVCKLACINSDEIQICGAEIFVGVAPEQPQNLSCIQKGEQGTVACTWERGRDTHLYTEYTLQLSGPKNLTWQKQCKDIYCDYLDFGINLTPESPESNFTAKVTAVNSLGSSSSLPSTFTFLDIVRPLPPWDIRIKFQKASVSRCTLYWRDEGLVLLNRLRYRPSNSRLWNMVNVTKAKGRHDLLDLKPFTEYEFQISSKLHLYKGSWSDWSESLRAQTPEEEPTGMLDVWYMKRHIDYSRQQISLFWKNLSVSEARGKILHYQVTLQELTGGKAMTQNITGHTSWTTVIPRTGNWAVAVSAANSKGSSLPTRINIMNLCEAGLLAPRQVSANSEGMDNILVTWQPPRKDPSAVQEYVVEWRELHPGGDTQVPLNWLRSRPYNVSALISEIPYRVSQNSHPINSLQPRVTYVLWMTALTAAGESSHGNEREFCLQGKANWMAFVAPSICIAIIMVGIFSTHYFQQKVFVLLAALRPQWCSREIPDPANSTCAKKYPIAEEKTQLPLDRLLIDWPTPEDPEPLVISEVLHQVTPVFRHPPCSNWPQREKGIQGHQASEKDMMHSASSPPPPRALQAESRQLVDLYKVLESRGSDPKPENPACPWTVLPAGDLPTHDGYLPSNIDDLPSHEAPLADSLEELEPQHISLSVFPSSSLHPLTFSCGDKLTLDQLKMRCDSLML
ncbi:interleukin 12 receptor subunit beta 2 [Homo sapiens]|uniref:Isoform 3 of Interleukin-12 receptor subunit beta-2 n=1 Tax=Homo sapiens TaxID=9606 RepID=Q99665-3|nr:interleukin-12 receptor subunit beta-2 isoform c precursor [Homo sapiens]XP_006710680.1 interleukin-12 receptor subunit beta-2 isoform X3 [Homo sapiens]XP_047275623.1 interleukin-12 receptor subunit beta-2 isoform X3 [Homo sapiens]KAI2517516.1 interleukin 12 receptor subunit beta 2 [Homo sapiens]KAI4081066.1 interleukin 12 receptor subunit beta 2 [Homo sapiens]|eukprot:NP_001245144.1 interleukin-12 receptor subunit beta-2 isoform c precursor [Homo sapiens]